MDNVTSCWNDPRSQLDLPYDLPVCALIRSTSPDGPSGTVLDFLNELSSANNRPVEVGCLSGIMAHVCEGFVSARHCGKPRSVPLSFWTTWSLIPSSIQTSESMLPALAASSVSASGKPAEMQNRGASKAAWGVMPRSTLSSTCTWPSEDER